MKGSRSEPEDRWAPTPSPVGNSCQAPRLRDELDLPQIKGIAPVAGEGVQRPLLRDVAVPNPLFLDSARDVQMIITAGGSKADVLAYASSNPNRARFHPSAA